MIDFTPTEEQEALKTMVREFVEREVKPKAAAYDAEPDPIKGIPWDIIEAGHKLGLKDLAVSEDLGGGGQDSLTLGMLVEELAVGDLGMSVIYAQTWKVIQMLQDSGTDEQRKKYLIPLLEDPVGCCAIAHLYIIFARSNTDVELTHGMSAFIVPRDLPGVEDCPGHRIGRVYDKIGERLAGNADQEFENCRVPMENMLWDWDTAWANAPMVLRQSNAYAGASTLGVGWAAFEKALEYSQMRVQDMVPIINHANISIKLADMYCSLRAAQMMVRRGCWQADHPDKFDPMIAKSVKPFCAETTMKVALEATKMFGGSGVMRDVGMEKLVRDATADTSTSIEK